MFFIAGITRNIGKAAAQMLLAEGKQVRALVRDLGKANAWVEKGVETPRWRTHRHGRARSRAGGR